MAKITAPLLSFGARGQIGKAQVYATWRGISYARQHVIPANPRTQEQQLTRSIFTTLSSMWAAAPPEMHTAWNVQAMGRPYTGRNNFMGTNTRALRTAEDFADFTASPGALSGISPASITVTKNLVDNELDVTVSVPSPPPGWSALKVHAVAFYDSSPPANWSGPILYAEGPADPGTLTFTGLDLDKPIVVSAWITWQRPDTRTAYGRSLTQIAS